MSSRKLSIFPVVHWFIAITLLQTGCENRPIDEVVVPNETDKSTVQIEMEMNPLHSPVFGTIANEASDVSVGLSANWQNFEKTDLIDEATKVMSILVEQFPNVPDAHEASARVQLLIGQTEAARKSWKRCLELNPDYGYAHHGLGLIAMKNSQYKEAISLFQKALETIPNYRDSVRELSDAFLKDGQVELAAKTLESFLESQADDSEFWLRLGQVCNAGLDFQKARLAFERSLQLSEENPKAEQGLITALVRVGERKKAKELADKVAARPARENDPIEQLLKNERMDISNRYWIAALVYRGFQRFDACMQLLQRAHQYDQSNTKVLESLIEQHIRQNELQTAYQYTLKLMELEPANANYFFGAAALAEKLNHKDDAKQHYRRVIELAPQDGKAYRQLVSLLALHREDLREAEEVAIAWTTRDPSAIPLAFLANTQAMQGKLLEAEQSLEKAIALDPLSNELQARLGQLRAAREKETK
ncbi:tetratricopeptide repeat protein [Pirellulaceae bacterium SH449]